MSNFYNKLEDKFNPIFINDLKKKTKTINFWLNLIFLFLVYLYLYYLILYDSPRNTYIFESNCYRIIAFYFLFSFAVIPLELYFRTYKEFVKDNIYFIFMSKITAFKFLNGKILAVVC